MYRKELTGMVFGKLTVINDCGRDKRGLVLWQCKCECGGEKIVCSSYLQRKAVRSCGCMITERIKQLHNQGTHNHCRRGRVNPTWTSWKAMHDRCKATHKSKKDYYDKGVLIDARWDNYDTFFADMGQRPTGMTLDRIDNNLGYTKINCRWADATTQMNNRTCVTKYEYQGETKSLTQWSRDKRCMVTACTLYARVLKYKFDFAKSMTTPKGEWK